MHSRTSGLCPLIVACLRRCLFVFVLLWISIGVHDQDGGGTGGCSAGDSSGPAPSPSSSFGVSGCAATSGSPQKRVAIIKPQGSGARGCDSSSGAQGYDSGSGSGAQGCNGGSISKSGGGSSGVRGCDASSGARGCDATGSGARGCSDDGGRSSGLMGCDAGSSGLQGCNNGGRSYADEGPTDIFALLFLPVTITVSTVYALSLMIVFTQVIVFSFIAPLLLMVYAIFIGSIALLVLAVIVVIAWAVAWWAYTRAGRRYQPHRSEEWDEDSSGEGEESEHGKVPQAVLLLPVALATVFLVVCAWRYGPLALAPASVPTTNTSTTWTTTSTRTLPAAHKPGPTLVVCSDGGTVCVEAISGSNWWPFCGAHMHACLEAAFCCCDEGYAYNQAWLACREYTQPQEQRP